MNPPPSPTPLEALLGQLPTEPAVRPAFFGLLLQSALLVPVRQRPVSLSPLAPDTLTHLDLHTLPDGRTPVFTSLERLALDNPALAATPTVAVRGRALLTALPPGTTLAINPFSPTSIALQPVFIQQLLADPTLPQ